MPVDPATLSTYRPPQGPRKPRAGRAMMLAIAVAAIALIGFFLIARGDAGLTRVFFFVTAALWAAGVLGLVVIGWKEDGVLGVLYRLRHPFGTILGGDDRPPWTAHAAGSLLILSAVLCGILMASSPTSDPRFVDKPA